MEEDDERSIELSSIAAIFPELVVDPSNSFAATLDVPVTPEKPLKIYFQSSTQAVPPDVITPPSSKSLEGEGIKKDAIPKPLAAALNVDTHQLSHLPPLKLHIDLPDGYPHDKPPNVVVRLDPVWLPQPTLDNLRDKCTELWKECGQDQVVYTFIDYVQQEAEKAFGLADQTHHKFELSSDLKLVLLDYDLKRKQEQFENETFECGICLDPKKGRICHRLILCGHVFCVACLQDFYNNCITEGDIDSVKCLDPGCGKEPKAETTPTKRRKIDYTLNPSELLQIPIEQELVQRYVRLKRKKRIEADKNTVYCPRQWCQGAARSKKHPKLDDPLQDAKDSDYESEEEIKPTKKQKKDQNDIPMSDRLSICEDCNYAFCAVCKKGWHGERANCNPRRQAELNAEEEASLEYMKKFSTPCPTCNAPAQKAYGCNHMICFKCKTHFCYLCSSYLMPDNPYKHFNDPKGTCYMRLWELEGGDGADVGMGFGGGNAAPWEAEEIDSDESDDEEDEVPIQAAQNWDDDSEDEEPAPDQRRAGRPHIEIVNFAANGVNRQIELPDNGLRPGAVAPAPAAVRNVRQRGNAPRRGNGRPQQAANHVPPPVPVAPVNRAIHNARQPADENREDFVHVAAAPGQGNNGDAALQRFLRLALQDREDEWDSDEDDLPNAPVARPRQNRRRI